MLFDLGFMHGWDYAKAREKACKAEANRLQQEYERNNVKMTREEAVKKIMLDNRCSDYTFMRERGYVEAYVKGLEALGLLKFEEEKELSDDAEICLRTNVKDRAIYSTLGAMKDAVGYHGYKIVKA